ncbi:MAG: helix-turn-helix domain-containing protein [Methylocella sp.]
MITPEQIRGARAMLGITQAELAERAGVSTTGLNNIERGEADPKASTLKAVKSALEAAGVLFVEENGEGPGVRLKKKPLAVAEITEKIEALNEKISAITVEGDPSPQIGMNRLKKALVQNERTKLKNRRAKIKKSEPK